MKRNNITKRYVFIIEQICRPGSEAGSEDGCHGWVKYRIPQTGIEIKKPFGKLQTLPQVIRELMSEVDEDVNGHSNEI